MARVAGLTSGMDIESMVKNLMKPEEAKLDKLLKKQTLLTWQQEAFRSHITKINDFQSKYLSFTNPATNMLSASSFNLKNFTVQMNGVDTKTVTVKNSGAKNASHTINVTKLAAAEKKVSSSNASKSLSITGEKVDLANIEIGTSITLNLDGKTVTAKFDAADSSLIADLKNTAIPQSNRMQLLADKLNQTFQSTTNGFGTEADGRNKVTIGVSGDCLTFSTNAGRGVSIAGFSNGVDAAKQFAYDSTKIADSLSFSINGTAINGISTLKNTYNTSFNYNTGDIADTLSFDIGGKSIVVSTKDGSGNRLSADDLVSKINTAMQDKGIDGTKLNVSNDGGNIKFNALSADSDFKITETTSGGTKLTDGNAFEVYGSNATHVNAQELVKRINEKINAATASNPSIKTENIAAQLDGTNIKFVGISQTEKFTIQETTSAADDAKLTGTTGEFALCGRKDSVLGGKVGSSTANDSSVTVGSMFSGYDFANFEINGKKFSELGIDSTTTIATMITKLNKSDLGITVSHSTVSGKFTFESNQSGANSSGGYIKTNEELDLAFGFKYKDAGNNIVESEANVVGNDIELTIDGEATTRSSNTFTIDGMEVTIGKDVEIGKDIKISSNADTASIRTNIKAFVTSFNELLTSVISDVSASRARSGSYSYYEPLTSEEKSAMSEKDVEAWEKKAKEGILSRDPMLTKLADALRSAVSSPIKLADGRTMSLANIGISSTSWEDRGVLTIDEEKLQKALEEHPDDVVELFTKSSGELYASGDRSVRNAENGLSERLNDVLKDATSLNSTNKSGSIGYLITKAGKVGTSKVSQNDISKALKDLAATIYTQEQRNISKENSYYDMFSRMESAMKKAQDQQANLGF